MKKRGNTIEDKENNNSMDRLNLSDNIIRLRRERRITQEELADFLGVSKAAVSKWENAQSTPDLMLLLELSAYFGTTIDELIGYKAKLSKEQIRYFYAELVKDFARLPFHEAIEKTRTLAHRYYSCHAFLLQLTVLYLNHYMLAESEEEQKQLLEEAASWCDHILEGCSDVSICSDALVLKAGISLWLGKAAETITMLEPSSDPARLAGQDGAILVQAYQMAGEHEKARGYIQAREWLDILNLVSDAAISLALYQDDIERCKKTVCRIRNVMEAYLLEKLHPNLAAQFHYQAAVMYAAVGEEEEALKALFLFEKCVDGLLRAERVVLHGDEYFDRLDAWIEALPLGEMAPRSRKFVFQNLQEAFSHPAFEALKENADFQKILQHFAKTDT